MDASRTVLPTRTTRPPRTSGSTRGRELDLAAGLLADAVADLADGLLVELDRGGDLARAGACSPPPRAGQDRADAEQRRHPVVLDQQVEEVHEDRVGAVDGLVQAVLLLLGGEVGREEEHLQVAVARETRRRPGRAARGPRRACRRPAPPRRATGRRRWRSPPSRPQPSFAAQGGEVELGEGVLDQAALVVVGERLARDLLRGEDGEVGDLVADLLDRRGWSPPRSRGGSAPSAPRACAWPRRATRPPACSPVLRARATISSAWSRASASRSRYSASSSSASVRVRSAESIDSSIACWRLSSASAMRGNANFASTYSEMPKTTSVQIISPTSGETRKLPLPSSPPPASAAKTVRARAIAS